MTSRGVNQREEPQREPIASLHDWEGLEDFWRAEYRVRDVTKRRAAGTADEAANLLGSGSCREMLLRQNSWSPNLFVSPCYAAGFAGDAAHEFVVLVQVHTPIADAKTCFVSVPTKC